MKHRDQRPHFPGYEGLQPNHDQSTSLLAPREFKTGDGILLILLR